MSLPSDADDVTEAADRDEAALPAGARRTDAEHLRRGQKVGPFEIDGFLGRGGMGAVYSAVDPRLERRVAIKFVLGDVAGSVGSDRRTRLEREARALAKLSHPNVVQVFEIGEHDGVLYLVMEYIDGTTLTRAMQQLPTGDDRWRQALALLLPAAAGLAAAHDAGLVHRDFKPDNVMVEASGRVRVMDFGLARTATLEQPVAAVPSKADVSLTQTGTMIGTPAYMAPEQLAGGEVDMRSDQYAFCVVLFEAIAQRRPIAARSVPELIRAVLEGDGPDLRGAAAPPALINAIRRGLSRDPAHRFASMSELRVALQKLQEPPHRSTMRGAVAIAAALGFGALGFAMLGGDELDAHNPDGPLRMQVAGGTLDPAEIRAVVVSHIDEIQSCYSDAIRLNPASGGKVLIRGVIGESGNVESAAIDDGSVVDPFLGSCIAATMMGWRFPAPQGGRVMFRYPFMLEPG